MTDTVWIAPAAGSQVYHTTRECRYVTPDHRERDADVMRAWYRECKHCANEYTPHRDDNQSKNAIEK